MDAKNHNDGDEIRPETCPLEISLEIGEENIRDWRTLVMEG